MDLSKPFFPNLLLVAGNGRNSGKTTLITRVIHRLKNEYPVTGIKISPHFHEKPPAGRSEGDLPFIIQKEHDLSGNKDSSRMLLAGADEVFYIQAKEEDVPEAFFVLLKDLDSNKLWICESGALRKYVRPGLFLLVSPGDSTSWKPSSKELLQYADRIIWFGVNGFDPDISCIRVLNRAWKMVTF